MTFKLPEGRTIRVLFHACEVQKTILTLGCLAEQESDLRADTGTLFFFRNKIQTQLSQTPLHKDECFVFCPRDADGALGDSWCE